MLPALESARRPALAAGAALLVLVLAAPAQGPGAQGPGAQSPDVQGPDGLAATPAPAGQPALLPDSVLHLATFDHAWTRILESYYDPAMGGVDWDEARRTLRPAAGAATSTEELRGVIRTLIGSLEESHFVLIPGEARTPEGDPAEREDPGEEGDPGLELRWIGGEALVVRVSDAAPAHAAGVRPGFVVRAIDGRPIEELLDGLLDGAGAPEPDTPLTLAWIHGVLHRALAGARHDSLALRVLDAEGEERELEFLRGAPPGEVVRFGNLPPVRLEVESREVGEVGVIRFTGWFPSAAPRIAEAVDRFRGHRGIVLDLRGNPGGVGGLVMGIGGHFLDERIELGTMRTRDAEVRFIANPQRVGPEGGRVVPFAGPLAILVDPMTGSTSEIFAAGMQAIERARVFGEPSAGQALPALITELPNGDRLMHAIADFTGPDGTRIEGRGVIPDEAIVPERGALLAGQDPVLDGALRWISGSPSSHDMEQER